MFVVPTGVQSAQSAGRQHVECRREALLGVFLVRVNPNYLPGRAEYGASRGNHVYVLVRYAKSKMMSIVAISLAVSQYQCITEHLVTNVSW